MYGYKHRILQIFINIIKINSHIKKEKLKQCLNKYLHIMIKYYF